MPSIQVNQNRTVSVSYPMKEQTSAITFAEYELIRNLLTGVNNSSYLKLRCIKFLIGQYKLNLYEAKKIVETICDQADYTWWTRNPDGVTPVDAEISKELI